MIDPAHALSGHSRPGYEERVLILAPTGRDASLAAGALAEAGHQSEICQTFDHLIAGIEEGAATAIIAEEAFAPYWLHRLGRFLARQPSWSDFPLLILTSGGESQEAGWRTVRDLDPLGNVTLLERPFRVITLLSAVQVALRARRHQYKVRDYMVERELIEYSLRQSEERLHVALAAAHMGTWVWDLRTNQDTRNASLNGILGIAETESTQSADDFMERSIRRIGQASPRRFGVRSVTGEPTRRSSASCSLTGPSGGFATGGKCCAMPADNRFT